MRTRLLSLLLISVGLLLHLGEAYANGASPAPPASSPSILETLSGGTALSLGGLGVLVVGIVVVLLRIARWAGRG